MTDTTTETCSYGCGNPDDVRCDLCDRPIMPPCGAIHISTGHLESPDGDRGFDLCPDCAGQRAGFAESVAMLTAEVTGKWAAERVPYNALDQAHKAAKAAYADATAEQRKAFNAAMDEAAQAFKAATGEDMHTWYRHA